MTITSDELKAVLLGRLKADSEERSAEIAKLKALPPEKQAKNRPCPGCGKEALLYLDQKCLSCLIDSIPRGEFKPEPFYNRVGDIFEWYFEDVVSYAKWHPHGGLHTYHAQDDDRIVGFNIWDASHFCYRIFKLIMEEDDDDSNQGREEGKEEGPASVEVQPGQGQVLPGPD